MKRAAALFGMLLALLTGFVPAAASAHAHDGSVTKFFSDEYVGPDETIHGDVNVVFGNARVEGHVTGDVNVIGGSCAVSDSGEVDGNTNCVWNDAATALSPLVVASSSLEGFAQIDRRLLVKLASCAIVALMFLLFPVRMRLALDRVERHPGVSAAVGVASFIAVVPLAILLILSLIGIPLIVVEIAALFAGVWLGTGAIALLVGRRLCELAMPQLTPTPLAALVLGLIVVSAAEIVPIVGWAVTALVWLIGLGSAVLSFIRVPGGPPGFAFSAPGAPRPPIGGPPMRPSR